jgi:NAD(P)-dependent dehydrogenase (short-subunit alcohol dehydrogenase family)
MAVEINLENKTALVTGGTRGIGKAIVDELLQSGAKVLLLAQMLHKLKSSIRQTKTYNLHICN